MRDLMLILSITIASGWAAGCGDATGPKGSEAPRDTLFNEYQLQTVGGQSLYTARTPPHIDWGDLQFYDGGELMTVIHSSGTEEAAAGRWRRAVNRVVLTYRSGDTISGILGGHTLTFDARNDPRLSTGSGLSMVLALGSDWAAGRRPPSSGGGGPPDCSQGCVGWGGGSCPLMYTWDGSRWHLDSGTFGGAIAPGLRRTDLDELPHAVAIAGRVRLRMTNELPETEHVDAVELVAVDHAPDSFAVPDAAGGVHILSGLRTPIAARDRDGREVRGLLVRADGRAWESAVRERDPRRAASLRDGVEVTFARPAGARRAWLVVDAQNTRWATYLLKSFLDAQGAGVYAWYAALRLRTVADVMERRFVREGFLHVALATGAFWTQQGFLWEAGPEVMKRQAVPLDLSRVQGDTVRVRLDAPPSFWRIDAVALAVEDGGAVAVGRGQAGQLNGGTAGGRVGGGADDLGPTPPGYAAGIAERAIRRVPAVTGDAGGRALPLLAAQAGDRSVRGVLGRVDGRHLTMERGDTVELVFAAPPVRAGLQRTYLLRSTGWYRIHSRTTGLPAFRTLARVAVDRDGMARMAVEWSNARLRAAPLARR